MSLKLFERKKRRKILEETTQNNNKRFCELLTPWSPRRKVDNRSRTTTGVCLGVGVDVGVGARDLVVMEDTTVM